MPPPPPLCYLDLQFYQFTNLFFLSFYSNNKFTSRCKLVDRSINRKIYRFVRVIHSWWIIISYKSALLCSFVIIYKRRNFRFLFFFRFLLLPSSSFFFTIFHARMNSRSNRYAKFRFLEITSPFPATYLSICSSIVVFLKPFFLPPRTRRNEIYKITRERISH